MPPTGTSVKLLIWVRLSQWQRSLFVQSHGNPEDEALAEFAIDDRLSAIKKHIRYFIPATPKLFKNSHNELKRTPPNALHPEVNAKRSTR